MLLKRVTTCTTCASWADCSKKEQNAVELIPCQHWKQRDYWGGPNVSTSKTRITQSVMCDRCINKTCPDFGGNSVQGSCSRFVSKEQSQKMHDALPDIEDLINKPSHYIKGPIESIDIIEAFKLNFRLGNVIKYILRHQEKGGLEDLKKAQWYLNREIKKNEPK